MCFLLSFVLFLPPLPHCIIVTWAILIEPLQKKNLVFPKPIDPPRLLGRLTERFSGPLPKIWIHQFAGGAQEYAISIKAPSFLRLIWVCTDLKHISQCKPAYRNTYNATF